MVTRDLSAVVVLPSDAIDGNVRRVHVPSCLLVLGTKQLGLLLSSVAKILKRSIDT
jgi:hypothetical protein